MFKIVGTCKERKENSKIVADYIFTAQRAHAESQTRQRQTNIQPCGNDYTTISLIYGPVSNIGLLERMPGFCSRYAAHAITGEVSCLANIKE